MNNDKNIINLINKLDEGPNEGAKEELKKLLINDLQLPLDLRKKAINSKGLDCLYCKSLDCVYFKKGLKDRILCKSCYRTFRITSGTPLQGIHSIEKWNRFIPYFIDSESIRYIAKKLELNKNTVLNWRHKALAALSKHKWITDNKGIVEIGSIQFQYSNKSPTHEPNEPLETEKIKPENQISCLLSENRLTGDFEIKLLNKGEVNATETLKKAEAYFKNANFISSSKSFESQLTETQNLIISGLIKHSQSIVKSMVNKTENIELRIDLLISWLKKFRGISSKYLSNYLNWFNLLCNINNKIDKILTTAYWVLISDTSHKRWREINKTFSEFYHQPNFDTKTG